MCLGCTLNVLSSLGNSVQLFTPQNIPGIHYLVLHKSFHNLPRKASYHAASNRQKNPNSRKARGHLPSERSLYLGHGESGWEAGVQGATVQVGRANFKIAEITL